MTFKELCQARYSCRAYQDKPIEAEKIEYIKECVRLAPSAVNRQPWRFLFITDLEQLAVVKACYKRDWIRNAHKLEAKSVDAFCCIDAFICRSDWLFQL